MTADINFFFFHPWLLKNKIEFRVILYVDSRLSYLTLPLVNFYCDIEIKLIALYPNSTDILQPLDVLVFHTVKTTWKKL